MGSIKNIITLNQAAKLSGYSQDYLGYLLRKGELKGKKVGRSWLTTEDEVRNYIFKQKIRHEKFPIKDFFSRRRTHNIFFATLVLFVGFFSLAFFMTNNNDVNNTPTKSQVTKTLSSEVEATEFIR
jgi:excisionase family DNA binding protein